MLALLWFITLVGTWLLWGNMVATYYLYDAWMIYGGLFVLLILWIYLLATNEELLLEVLLSALIISILVAIVVPMYQDNMYKAAVSETLVLGSGARVHLVEHYAQHGNWPTKHFRDINANGNYTSMTLEHGTITGRRQNSDLHLSMRPAILNPQAMTVVWVCGYAKPPPGFIVEGNNRTNMPPQYLSHVCRQ